MHHKDGTCANSQDQKYYSGLDPLWILKAGITASRMFPGDVSYPKVNKTVSPIFFILVFFVVACSKTKILGDTSLMTYRGHSVLRTLIRCRFSPSFSTGQRYIYTGCAMGRIFSKDFFIFKKKFQLHVYIYSLLSVYDVLTGVPATILTGHSECVRDVSWHPYTMDIVDSAVKPCT